MPSPARGTREIKRFSSGKRHLMPTSALPNRLLAAWALPAAFVIASVEFQRGWNTPLQWPYGLVVLTFGVTWIAALLDKAWAWNVAQNVVDGGVLIMAATGLALLGAGQTSPGQRALQDLLQWSPAICVWWATSKTGHPGRTATLVVALYLATLPGCWPDQLASYWQQAFQGTVLVFAVHAMLDALTRPATTTEALSGDAWMRDPSTDVANRSYIEAELAHLAAMANRYPFPFSVILIRVGDAQDAVLRDCAWRIVERVRRPDTVCRWDTRHFLVLLPNTVLADAYGVAEDLRAQLGQMTPVHTAVGQHPVGGEALAAVELAEQALHPRGGDPRASHPEARLPF